MEKLKKTGHLVSDNGLTWNSTTIRPSNGKPLVTDGPFLESTEQVGGVFVIEARDLNEAILVASKHPAARLALELELNEGKGASMATQARAVEDDRLRLVFTCCHPALSPDAQVALTLREVYGLTTEEIARASLTTAPTLAQRIVRAKTKIREARISPTKGTPPPQAHR